MFHPSKTEQEAFELDKKISSPYADKIDSEDVLPVPILGDESVVQASRKNKLLGAEGNSTVRAMKSRHLTFIAIGGTIGTGLFLSKSSESISSSTGLALFSD